MAGSVFTIDFNWQLDGSCTANWSSLARRPQSAHSQIQTRRIIAGTFLRPSLVLGWVSKRPLQSDIQGSYQAQLSPGIIAPFFLEACKSLFRSHFPRTCDPFSCTEFEYLHQCIKMSGHHHMYMMRLAKL